MDNLILHSVTVFMGFFAIMNPIANVPIFLALTQDDDPPTTKAIAMRSLVLAFFIVVAFSVAGKVIFAVFSITLPAFRITGGFLVFLIGYHMLHGDHSPVHQLSSEDNQKCQEAALSVAVTPLAMPILAGPGTIATAMSFSARGGFAQMGITMAAFGVLCVITYLFFVFSERFITFIGAGALSIITRMMGLILAVIGTQMAVEGLQDAFQLSKGSL